MGEVLISETGAEDLVKLKIGGKNKEWKVKTGHVMATTAGVEAEAHWYGPTEGAPIDSGFMMLGLSALNPLKDHYAWVWGFGRLRHHVLKENEHLVIDDAHIVAMQHPMKYSIQGATGMLGMPIGGDSLLMHFEGPGE